MALLSRSTIIATFLVLFSACAQKPITPSYSTVVEEAKNRGVDMPSIEHEREKFFKPDLENRERLVEIIGQRSREIQTDKEYKLGSGDEIEISVFDVEELNLKTQVKESGILTLPLIGNIKAEGLTEEALLNEITRRLKGFVINPQISMAISTYGSQKVAVVGAVKTPATYPLKQGSNSVMQLIAEAGGLTDKAGNILTFVPAEMSGLNIANDVEARARYALSVDAGETQPVTGIDVYLDNVMGTAGSLPVEIPVKGGDMIIIPEAGKVMVDGEVVKIGVYELGRQMSLLSALAAAGGITYSAKIDEIEIIRDMGNDSRAHLVVDLQKIFSGEERDYKLKNGDIIKVPSDSGRRLRNDTFETITRFINFGVGGSVRMGP